MNYFSPKSAAQRYSKGRLYFHPIIIERVKKFLSLDKPLPRALDVGCGTGLSTVALKEIASEVVGVDASFEMVALAPLDERVSYVLASGEQLPFTEGVFDLMTLSQVFHWLEREKFFGEARRVLRDGGRVVVYDNYFSGRMEESADFHEWFKENYPRRFPAPKRAKLAFEAEELEGSGFSLLGQEHFTNSIRFTLTRLVDYLLTHSNVIAAVEYGSDDIGEARPWLTEGIRPFYGDINEAGFIFDSVIWYLEKRLDVTPVACVAS